MGSSGSAAVQVLDAESLAEVARPTTAQVAQGDLSRVAWSADGRFLLAGGTWVAGGGNAVRRWSVQDWSRYQDIVVSRNTVSDLRLPLAAGGGWLFGANDPSWGVLDSSARVQRRQDPAIRDFRDQLERCRCRATAAACASAPPAAARRCSRRRRLAHARRRPAPLPAARTAAPGLAFTDWRGETEPKLNAEKLVLIATSPRAASPSPRTAGASWWAWSGTCGSSRGRARRAGVGPWRAPCGR